MKLNDIYEYLKPALNKDNEKCVEPDCVECLVYDRHHLMSLIQDLVKAVRNPIFERFEQIEEEEIHPSPLTDEEKRMLEEIEKE